MSIIKTLRNLIGALRRSSAIGYGSLAIAVVFANGFVCLARASTDCAGDICVEQSWARATPGGAQNAAIYFTIINNGAVEATLASASTAIAKQAMVHKNTMTGNVVHMDMVGSVTIPPHDRLTFAPRGYHVMLTGLKSPLKQGMTIPIVLRFARGAELAITIPVLSVAAAGPGSPPSTPKSMDNVPGMDHSHH